MFKVISAQELNFCRDKEKSEKTFEGVDVSDGCMYSVLKKYKNVQSIIDAVKEYNSEIIGHSMFENICGNTKIITLIFTTSCELSEYEDYDQMIQDIYVVNCLDSLNTEDIKQDV